MLGFNKTEIGNIIKNLDESGFIFPEFEFLKIDEQPQLIGIGGFSSIYEMFSIKRPEKKYALKVIGFEKHIVTSKQFWETIKLQKILSEETQYVMRIIDAKEILITLDDDINVSGIYEVENESWKDEGIHIQFVLMEKLEQVIVKDRFKKAYLTRPILHEEKEVAKFALQIGEAIHLAHKNSILHRDIKIENILWDESENCYKLGDFGIAKFVENGSAETVVYTDGYGAPEIERRLNDFYNATADIYSFGITLYLLLNDLKFPGSEGYYANIVQYDPEFTFPAPKNSTEKMNRIIRKMCCYKKEDRYQSITEVLSDIKKMLHIKEIDEKTDKEEDFELEVIETEIYKEEENSDVSKKINTKSEKTRAQKMTEEKKINELYFKYNSLYFIILTIICTLTIGGLQKETDFLLKWQFFIIPILILLEVTLIIVKEFHITFGIITTISFLYSLYFIGFTVPHIIMIFAILLGMPVFIAASSLGTLIWIVLINYNNISFINVIEKYNLTWIILVILFIVIYKMINTNIMLGKAKYTKTIIQLYIFDKIFIVIALVGVILFVLEKIEYITIPRIIEQMHLIRLGITSFIVYIIIELCDNNEYDEDNEDNSIVENVKES